jgi:RNA-directed DNA polymerase
VDVDLLRAAFFRLKWDAAPGVDGLTWREYEQSLEGNLADLHARVHRGAYRAQPSRRKFIPKAGGRERPLGTAALEDKIVQRAVVEVFHAIYEQSFWGSRMGFDATLTTSSLVSNKRAMLRDSWRTCVPGWRSSRYRCIRTRRA